MTDPMRDFDTSLARLRAIAEAPDHVRVTRLDRKLADMPIRQRRKVPRALIVAAWMAAAAVAGVVLGMWIERGLTGANAAVIQAEEWRG